MEAITIKQLTKKYMPPGRFKKLMVKSPIKVAKLAVDAVDLEIGRGELFGLIGPNGAGKTTLIKMLATLLRPSSGTARVNGFDVVLEEDKVRASIGFVSAEERSFYWRLTGRQNLVFFASLQNIKAKAAGEKISQLLETLSLDSAADDMYYSYSSGMKQKLMIARALLTDPQVLFLDEPTNSVDAVTAREIKDLIRERLVVDQGRTVILTSHRLDEVEALCDRIAIMDKGKVRFVGTVHQLSALISTEESFILEVRNLGSDNLSGVVSSVLARGGEIVSVDRRRPTLEEMFLDYLKEGSNEPAQQSDLLFS